MANPFESPPSALPPIVLIERRPSLYLNIDVANQERRLTYGGNQADKIDSTKSLPEPVMKAGRFNVKDITDENSTAVNSALISGQNTPNNLSADQDPISFLDAAKDAMRSIITQRDQIAAENARLRVENNELRRKLALF